MPHQAAQLYLRSTRRAFLLQILMPEVLHRRN